MSRQNIPTQPSARTIVYDNLLGIDYQSDSTEVNRRRSPEMVNMISDLGGNPVKRYGYRNLGQEVISIFEMNGTTYAIIEDGVEDTISSLTRNDNGTVNLIAVKNLTTLGEPKHAFAANGFIHLFLERVWYKVDLASITSASRTSYAGVNHISTRSIYRQAGTHAGTEEPRYDLNLDANPDDNSIKLNTPTVYTMLKPNGVEMVSLPAGTDITGATKGVNLLSPFIRAEYCVQADTVNESKFVLPTNGKSFISGAVEVEILTGDGYWEKVDAGDPDIGYTLSARGDIYCKLPDGSADGWFACYGTTLTFSNYAPFKPTETGITNAGGSLSSNDVPTSEPNLRITYAPLGAETGAYRKERCDAFTSDAVTVYDGRLFVAVGSRVYYSRAGEPFSIDDNFYFELDSKVTGLAKTANGLGVICEGAHPIYIASGEYSDELAMPVYSVKASSANIEEVVRVVGDALNDEPIIISRGGIYGISTNYYSNKYAIQRSGKINRRLCAEENLASAVGVVFKNYLWVAVGTNMYVLDGRHKDSSRNGDSSYECYFFNNMPAITDMWVADNRMYFSDGETLYTWNDDLDKNLHYRDALEWDDERLKWAGGSPVKALWTSALDGDGAPHYYKTLQKKGTMITVSPPMQTSCQVTLIRDANDKIYIGRFDGSTFSLSTSVLDAFTKKKVKKYKRLQFVIENNEAEPFGIVSIIKTFIVNNYAKR